MKTTTKKRRGRPAKPPEKTRSVRLDMRLEAAEKEAFQEAAGLSGLDLSAWIRERLRRAAVRELEEAARPIAFLRR